MVLQLYGGVAVLVVSAWLLGAALDSLGLRCRAAGPAVGLLGLIVIAAITIKLPGNATTAAICLLVADLLAAARLLLCRPQLRLSIWPALTVGVAVLGTAIPFLAAGRVGLQGVSFDNDSANHLTWAEGLRSSFTAAHYPASPGYPLGPHSLFDALASGLGLRLDLALAALVMAPVIVTALVGAAALPAGAGWARPVVGGLASLLYLPAGYYGEASFKETLLGLVVLAVAVHLQSLRRPAAEGDGGRAWTLLLPIAILCAGALYVYSYPALAWLVLTLVIWAAAEVVVRRSSWRDWHAAASRHLTGVAVACGCFVVLLIPIIGAISHFANDVGTSPAASGAISTANVGNLAGPLSAYEALGIWNNGDFRFTPANLFHAGEFGAFALALVVLGVIVTVRRRALIYPAALAACVIVYWDASHGQSAYVSAKALAIAGPTVAVIIGFALFDALPAGVARWVRGARLVVAAGFVVLAAHSSYLVLRDSTVWGSESTAELVSLARVTQGHRLIFLGNSDYASWIFGNTVMSTLDPTSPSAGPAASSPLKPNTAGTPFDFGSVNPAMVNDYDYMITTNTSFASQVPSGYRLVRRLRLYELWRRVATVAPEETIEAAGEPGGVLECSSNAQERKLSRQAGIAAVAKPPVTTAVPAVAPGDSATTTLSLPAGRWQLSLGYESQQPLVVSADGHSWRMPAYNDRVGPFFAVGSVVSSGQPLTVTIAQQRPSIFTGTVPAQFVSLAAVPDPDRRHLVPLRQACGRYVDWFRLQ